MSKQYAFHIDGAYTLATIPMERLADYMANVSKLLGESTQVHLSGFEDGSVVLKAAIDETARPKVRERILSVRRGMGPAEAMKAYGALDEMLRKDNSTGTLEGDGDGFAVVVQFPGRDRAEPLVFGPFRQDGTLEGQVLRVGGKDETVPVHLRDGEAIHIGLFTTPEIARRIAHHLLGPVIRVHGTGTWFRAADGTWELKSFKITDFDVLDEEALPEVVASLRRVKGSEWGEVQDPLQALLELRHGDGDAH